MVQFGYVDIKWCEDCSLLVNAFPDYSIFVLQQDNHIEASEEHPKKTKIFFAHAAETIDAEFYAKVNDDLYVNTGRP